MVWFEKSALAVRPRSVAAASSKLFAPLPLHRRRRGILHNLVHVVVFCLSLPAQVSSQDPLSDLDDVNGTDAQRPNASVMVMATSASVMVMATRTLANLSATVRANSSPVRITFQAPTRSSSTDVQRPNASAMVKAIRAMAKAARAARWNATAQALERRATDREEEDLEAEAKAVARQAAEAKRRQKQELERTMAKELAAIEASRAPVRQERRNCTFQGAVRAVLKPLQEIALGYSQALQEMPCLTTALTSATLSCIGDVICQTKLNHNPVDLQRNLAMTTWGGFWDGAVGYYIAVTYIVIIPEWFKQSALRQGIICSIMDNFWTTPFMYTPLFYIATGLMQSQTLRQALLALRNSWWMSCWTAWILWCPIQVLNYGVVPAHARVVLISVVNLVWNIIIDFLSHMSQKGHQQAPSANLVARSTASGSPTYVANISAVAVTLIGLMLSCIAGVTALVNILQCRQGRDRHRGVGEDPLLDVGA